MVCPLSGKKLAAPSGSLHSQGGCCQEVPTSLPVTVNTLGSLHQVCGHHTYYHVTDHGGSLLRVPSSVTHRAQCSALHLRTQD